MSEVDRSNNPGHTLDRFQWASKSIENLPHVRTLDAIKSLSGGVAVILEIIEADQLNDDDGDCFGRVLHHSQTMALMRLAIAVSEQIQGECDDALTWAEKHGAKMNRAG